MAIGTYISITLNVNGLNAPTKRHQLAEWIQKQDLYIYYINETHLGLIQIETEGLEKRIPCKWKSKIARVAILGKIYFKIKSTTRDKEWHYIIIKGII